MNLLNFTLDKIHERNVSRILYGLLFRLAELNTLVDVHTLKRAMDVFFSRPVRSRGLPSVSFFFLVQLLSCLNFFRLSWSHLPGADRKASGAGRSLTYQYMQFKGGSL